MKPITQPSASASEFDSQPRLALLENPSLEGCHRCARHVVVPLLFTEAFHATVDVPEAVRNVTESVPFHLIVTGILGTGDDMAQLLRESMASSGIDDRASVLLFAVGSSVPAANEAVVDLAVRLAEDRRGLVRACFGTCSPGVADVMNGLPEPVAVVPLFLTDGLLLTSVRELAAQRGWQMAEPLGERAAELVLLRYTQTQVS